MEWFIKVLKNYATFSGRARRKEYWMFTLISIIISIVLGIIDNALGLHIGEPSIRFGVETEANGILSSIFSLVILIPSLAVSTRRLHDINKSGWWIASFYVSIFVIAFLTVFIGFVALIAILVIAIWFIVLLATNGDVGSNQYGPDPKNENSLSGNDDILDSHLLDD